MKKASWFTVCILSIVLACSGAAWAGPVLDGILKRGELVVGETKLTVKPFGVAMREDALLINAVENAFKTLALTGGMKVLQDKWFKGRSGFDRLP